jgi:hypothetical protein
VVQTRDKSNNRQNTCTNNEPHRFPAVFRDWLVKLGENDSSRACGRRRVEEMGKRKTLQEQLGEGVWLIANKKWHMLIASFRSVVLYMNFDPSVFSRNKDKHSPELVQKRRWKFHPLPGIRKHCPGSAKKKPYTISIDAFILTW